MNKRLLYPILLIFPLLIGSVAFAPQTPRAAPLPAPALSITGQTHVSVHGTLWEAERPTQFSVFRRYAWGTRAQAKVASRPWIHIPMVYPTYIDMLPQKLVSVEFCAKSSDGALARPVRMELWDLEFKVAQKAIAWPADNLYHCQTYTFGSPVWFDEIGLSVQLKFDNTTDTINLYKAWIAVQP